MRRRERTGSFIPPLVVPLKNRAAARWLYVVTTEAGIRGKLSALLSQLLRTHRIHTNTHRAFIYRAYVVLHTVCGSVL